VKLGLITCVSTVITSVCALAPNDVVIYILRIFFNQV
jgi:hypothetical protein